MKRTFSILSVLSFALIMTVAAFGQAASQQKPETLTKQQLNTLIATAKTHAEHQRIASFYDLSAQDYKAQAQDHQEMIASYKANSSLSNNKNWASTIGHCEYFVKTLNQLAVKSEELAKMHEKMATESE
jgi:hypothetical protein